MPKSPSPCIDVCKYKRKGHCIACSMTKPQKSIFKRLHKESQRKGFLTMLMAQQAQFGKYEAWRAAYADKCKKKGAEAPF